MMEPPVRPCCGQRHGSVRCPDGRVMCSSCFGLFTDDKLMRDAGDPSKRWDVCVPCGEREGTFHAFYIMAGLRL